LKVKRHAFIAEGELSSRLDEQANSMCITHIAQVVLLTAFFLRILT
jgi:hypothetical protein